MGFVLGFCAGFIAGLSWLVPFAVGLKARKNLEVTGSIIGRVKEQKPIFRTDQEEAELEEYLDATGQH
jgi:hypothetical protein